VFLFSPGRQSARQTPLCAGEYSGQVLREIAAWINIRAQPLNQKQWFTNACQSNELSRADARRKVEHYDRKQPP